MQENLLNHNVLEGLRQALGQELQGVPVVDSNRYMTVTTQLKPDALRLKSGIEVPRDPPKYFIELSGVGAEVPSESDPKWRIHDFDHLARFGALKLCQRMKRQGTAEIKDFRITGSTWEDVVETLKTALSPENAKCVPPLPER